MKSIQSIAALWAACLLVCLLSGCSKRPVTTIEVENPRPAPWSDEVVESFGRIPTQERGRIKPLSTYFGFRMLSLNGKRKWTIPDESGLPTDGEVLDPVRLALDIMFFSEQARQYELFLVNDRLVLDRLGLSFEGRKRRDRYSYSQLSPARGKLDVEADRIREKDAKSLDSVEKQMLTLQQNLFEFELIDLLARSWTVRIGPEPSARLLELYPEGADGQDFPLSIAVDRILTVGEWLRAAGQQTPAAKAVEREIRWLDRSINACSPAFIPAFMPDEDPAVAEWRNQAGVVLRSTDPEKKLADSDRAIMDAFIQFSEAKGNMAAAAAAIANVEELTVAAAEARGEFADVELERSYYARDHFTYALVFFLVGFLLAATSWMLPRVKALHYGVWIAALAGLVYAVVGVTTRCILLERPPVATLYETILFITSCAVFACLVTEKITKTRLTLHAGVVLGAAGMFLAGKYELVETRASGDTMGGLLAVLNTNFWLATHVTTVTLGYSAGLLAAFLGHVWLFFRIGFGVKNWSRDLTRPQSAQLAQFGKILYGVLCFGLLFSVVGTILGGVWANDSWGRFWGWDPKENGALMIVLYELVIVHARLGGYIKHYGVAVLSVLGGSIVAFSWWHVNQLGVGMHSYGFTDGIMDTLNVYYAFVAGFVVLSVLAWSIFFAPKRKVGSV